MGGLVLVLVLGLVLEVALSECWMLSWAGLVVLVNDE